MGQSATLGRSLGAMGLIAGMGSLLLLPGGCGQAPDDDLAQAGGELGWDHQGAASAGRLAAPRLLAPLSTTVSVSQRPVFRWTAPHRGQVTVEVCGDRACSAVLTAFHTSRSFARPAQALPAGVVFWRVSDRVGRRTLRSAVWQLTIPARDSGRTGSWSAVPDFNGDGFGDLVVGAKVANHEVRIFPGGPTGVATTPAQVLSGPPGFGDELGPAGDLDGDGFGDLAIWIGGPPAQVAVYRGGISGPSSPVIFAGPEADFLSQMRVVSAGDVDGDGYGDLLVGGGAFAQLFLGSASGVQTTPAQNLPSATPASGTAPDARWPIGGADFNGDGFPDAVIDGTQGSLLYQGDGQTLVARPDIAAPAGFGALAGDFNGDGFADLANYAVTTGGPAGPVTSFQAIAGEYAYQGVGDTNRDGRSDVLYMVSSLVGVREAEHLYFGVEIPCLSNDCPSRVPLFVPGHQNDGNPFFVTIAGGIGDVNGDGFADLAYGSPGAGAVYLFLGSPAGPPPDPSLTITAEQGFGFSLARM